MTTNNLTSRDADDSARLLDAFANVLEHPDLPRTIVHALADELGDLGGARYGMLNDFPAGAAYTAQFAREVAGRLRGASDL